MMVVVHLPAVEVNVIQPVKCIEVKHKSCEVNVVDQCRQSEE